MSSEILVVDDEQLIRESIADLLEDEGYSVRLAKDADEVFSEVAARCPALILLDIWLEGSKLDGMEILKRLRQDDIDVPILMISGHGSIETAVTSIKHGAYDFIEKPFKADKLLVLISRALEAAALRRENAELKLRSGGEPELIGESLAIQNVKSAIRKVAPTGSRVLIHGAAGVGKEIVARLIHDQSRRASAPFIVMNAANMAPDRIEVELFGAEADALGPGRPRMLGTFERAHGGTLLLDEVAEMPIETQAKILRVLQEQSFCRIGGQQRVKVDVRVIAATNRDLEAEMELGNFRRDLYYRLNVVPIRVPSLDERRQDIATLASYFMERAAANAGVSLRVISNEAMTIMQTARWPGNVRQLRNVVEWMLIMAPGDNGEGIGIDGLPPELIEDTTSDMNPISNGELMTLRLREARHQFERSYLQAQLDRFGGNISKTASFVGMERSALHRKLKSLNINGAEASESGTAH